MTFIDWAIFTILLAMLLGVGIWGRRFTKTVSQFTVAGRGMGMWLGLSTAFSEGIGLISIANFAQLGFKKGFSYLWLMLAGLLLMNIPVFGILGLGIERYRATKVQTLPQFYQMRFSRGVRIFAGITLGIGGVLNMAIFPIVGSQFLVTFLGFPEVFEIGSFSFRTFPVMLLIVLGIAFTFTVLGGMVTVIITDYVQSVIMFGAITLISFMIFRNTGISGLKNAVEIHLGDAAFNPFLKNSLGPVFICVFFMSQFIHKLAFPPALQKMSAATTPKVVKRMFLLSSIFGQGRLMLLVTWGIAALCILGPNIPQGYAPEIYTRVVAAVMLRQITPPILAGIAFTGFVFAFISTVDSYLLSWSSVIANDCICTVMKKAPSNKNHLRLLRLTSLGIALFIFCFGLYYKPSESIVQYFYLTGAIFVGCGLLTWFGLYWKGASSTGAWACLIAALVIPLGYIFLKQHITCIGNLKNDWVTFASILITTGLFIALSILFPDKNKKLVDYGQKLKEMDY